MRLFPSSTGNAIAGVRFDAQGLAPAIVQDQVSGAVLTLAYMNAESLARTVETGETWFYSRSRQQLWHKGETSGNIQKVITIDTDCDNDALLVVASPAGPACHTGRFSCFDGDQESERPRLRESGSEILALLEDRVRQREQERPEGSYTTYLFDQGIDKILKKVGEETAEVIIAAKNRSADELRYEAADLIYHLMVLLREQTLPVQDVLRELSSRYAPE
ncbi:MAG: bifunctional phosphoribosyl-AMP cyclohydrolase/phosphoribosyl-ATP diphosphatase HisIE [Bacilli bacterium]